MNSASSMENDRSLKDSGADSAPDPGSHLGPDFTHVKEWIFDLDNTLYCANNGIFAQIAAPLLLPALASLAIIIFIWSWGAFLWPLVIVQDKALNVLSVGLTTHTQPYLGQPMWAAAMAASTVATVPIAALFIFCQRYFVQGLTAAAVKG